MKPPYDYRLNKPFLTPIIDIIEENNRIKTFIVEYNPISEPVKINSGQFVMVWIPGSDEIPMSVSHIGKNSKISISVADVGETTHLMHQLKIGDKIGIRGPYGNWFTSQNGTTIVIGGGIGMASVLSIVQDLSNHKNNPADIKIDKIICINGAKTKSELCFTEELQKISKENDSLEICTDDGSHGFKGFTSERLKEILNKEKSNAITVYACGPEKMLKSVFQICEDHKKIPVQLSLERMMRCGFGICGLCALEPTGLLVCRDGPIFTNETIREITDFGKIHRDFSGKTYSI